MEKKQDIRQLYSKFLENSINEEEYKVLLDCFRSGVEHKELQKLMMKFLEDEEPGNTLYLHRDRIQQARQSVKEKLDRTIGLKKTPLIPFRIRLFPYVAASLALIIGVVSYRYLGKPTQVHPERFTKTTIDIPPGSNKAVLKLANGNEIVLNDKGGSLLTQDGNISYADGTKINSSADVQVVTVSTPLAAQYQVKLPDGTKAWLNAGSSISYPTRFVNRQRKISITGEVYLEVAKDPNHPFMVSAAKQEMEVLGTTFNINTYGDNNRLYTTLIEGSLKITHTATGINKILKAGEQAIISESTVTLSVATVDTDEISSWKDGFYVINDQPLSVFGKQIERWYDVTVDMQGKGVINMSAIIPRDISLSEVLKAIEIKTGIKFTIEGRRVIAKG